MFLNNKLAFLSVGMTFLLDWKLLGPSLSVSSFPYFFNAARGGFLADDPGFCGIAACVIAKSAADFYSAMRVNLLFASICEVVVALVDCSYAYRGNECCSASAKWQ